MMVVDLASGGGAFDDGAEEHRVFGGSAWSR